MESTQITKDKIVKFINVHVKMSNCTLRCHYCYVTISKTFGHPIPKLEYSATFIRQALSQKRLGGCCHLNFCADGETLLLPELIDVVRELLEEGHYISIVTNATLSNKIDQLIALPAHLRSHLFIKASYHYLELVERNLIDTFFDNVNRLHKSGISITIEVTPKDELSPYAEEAVNICRERTGASPHFTLARNDRYRHQPLLTNLSREDYRKTWGRFNSTMFNFKERIFGIPVKKFCYAGEWFLCLELLSGNLTKCHGTPVIQNIYSDLNEPIKLEAIGRRCPRAYCYNGHALLTMGMVPGIESPTYAETRDRVNANGEHWLHPDVRAAFSQRFYENNPHYPYFKRLNMTIRYYGHLLKTKLRHYTQRK